MKIWIYEYLVSFLGKSEDFQGMGAAMVHRDKPIKCIADIRECEKYLAENTSYGQVAITHYQLIDRRWRW